MAPGGIVVKQPVASPRDVARAQRRDVSQKRSDSAFLEGRLWGAADELRANSKLKSSEYSIPVLGLIFLRYADQRFREAEKSLAKKGSARRQIGKTDYHAAGVLYLPPEARFDALLRLPEGENLGRAINDAMKAVEAENPDLRDVLPKSYNRLENAAAIEAFRKEVLKLHAVLQELEEAEKASTPFLPLSLVESTR